MTTTDTNACRRGQELISSDPVGDDMIRDILHAHKQGFDVNEYVSARAAGASHERIEECVALYRSNQDSAARQDPYALAINVHSAGLDQVEIDMFKTNGYALNLFAEAKLAGMTHEEFLTYVTRSSEPAELTLLLWSRKAGITHRELSTYIAMFGITVQLDQVAGCRNKGVTHDDYEHFSSQVDSLSALKQVLEQLYTEEVTSDELGALKTAGVVDVSAYVKAKELGASHEEVLDVHNLGCALNTYVRALRAGATTQEVKTAAAASDGITEDYVSLCL
jgi:hypothetical protein